MNETSIPALIPRGAGHQFVLYGDSCSGVPGALHEKTHADINSVVSRLLPKPEFIIFPGDEIIGLTSDESELRAQWDYWLNHEMAWLDRKTIPLYNSTGNHTTYSAMSERVFTDVLSHLPRNGVPGQEGLSYFVRRGDLLLVFVDTLCSKLGGEGHVETAWLEATLMANADAKWKFVIGHHPVFTVNGYAGNYGRTIGDEYRPVFWRILKEQGVFAYLCSHILAFDVQAQDGVLQITTAGAGTAHRMPEESEYLHALQVALDGDGMRYQVLDADGTVRERLSWPLNLPCSARWTDLAEGKQSALLSGRQEAAGTRPAVCAWNIQGKTGDNLTGQRQTLLSACSRDGRHEAVWLGLSGTNQTLTMMLQPQSGRSPHYWFGGDIGSGNAFDLQVAVHCGMGPGGIMWRPDDHAPWSSLSSSSSWGGERLDWPEYWYVGDDSSAALPFLGSGLKLKTYTQI